MEHEFHYQTQDKRVIRLLLESSYSNPLKVSVILESNEIVPLDASNVGLCEFERYKIIHLVKQMLSRGTRLGGVCA